MVFEEPHVLGGNFAVESPLGLRNGAARSVTHDSYLSGATLSDAPRLLCPKITSIGSTAFALLNITRTTPWPCGSTLDLESSPKIMGTALPDYL